MARLGAGHLSYELLVDSGAFWGALERDIDQADERVWIQCLSFEADDAGRPLANALVERDDLDRRVIADALFCRHMINDRFVWSPSNWFDRDLRDERQATLAMLEAIQASGATVKLSNPVGLLLRRAPRRGHKKVLVIDDRVAYVGGFNFSDHNFAWHDMMVRITDPDVVAHLAADLEATWQGRSRRSHERIGSAEIISLDGRRNPEMFEPLLDRIRGARSSLRIVSPYLSPPFTAPIRTAAERGAEVEMITPARNNWPLFRTATLWEAKRHGYDVHLYPERMNHMKAILVDDEALVVGSSNFDLFSYWLHEEIVLVVDDPSVVESFQKAVLEPDRATSSEPSAWPSAIAGRTANGLLASIAQATRAYAPIARWGPSVRPLPDGW